MDFLDVMKPIRKLAMVANKEKMGAVDLADELETIATSCDVEVVMTSEFPVPEGFLQSMDACCVIGGDGTLLSVVQESAREQVPIDIRRHLDRGVPQAMLHHLERQP